MSPRRPTRTAQAIVLDRTKLGEMDLILTMLGSDGCQLRAVARGARKPGGRMAGRTDLFCECDLLLAHGRSLDSVAEASLVQAHTGLAADLDRVSAASTVAEVAKLTSFEDAQDPWLYGACSRALSACEQASDRAHLDIVVAGYALKVCAHLGWPPVLDACVECGDEAVTRLSAMAGGALCESCARTHEGAEPISPSQLGWISHLLKATFDELLAVEVDDATAAWLLAWAHVWCATHLDCRLRSFEFMLSV